VAKLSGEHTPLGGFVLPAKEPMRQIWMKANYLVAAALATFGWLWLIVCIFKQLI
jgi:hypothetical protein